MATQIEQVKTLRDAAITALESGDFATAKSKILQARTKFYGLPNDLMEKGNRIVFRESINEILAEIRLQEREAGSGAHGLQTTTITYGNPGGS